MPHDAVIIWGSFVVEGELDIFRARYVKCSIDSIYKHAYLGAK